METRLRILAAVYGIPFEPEMDFSLFCALCRHAKRLAPFVPPILS